MIKRANGVRYPLVGGMGQRHFEGTNSKPGKLLENAQTPTSRVHAVLGAAIFLMILLNQRNHLIEININQTCRKEDRTCAKNAV